MRYLILTLIFLISACGKAPDQTPIAATPVSVSIPESACEMRDSCTYADVPGYECVASRWEPTTGDGAQLPETFYKGAKCVITKEDHEFTQGCDISNPTAMCIQGGWGSPKTQVPCCQVIQGPGLPSDMN